MTRAVLLIMVLLAVIIGGGAKAGVYRCGNLYTDKPKSGCEVVDIQPPPPPQPLYGGLPPAYYLPGGPVLDYGPLYPAPYWGQAITTRRPHHGYRRWRPVTN